MAVSDPKKEKPLLSAATKEIESMTVFRVFSAGITDHFGCRLNRGIYPPG